MRTSSKQCHRTYVLVISSIAALSGLLFGFDTAVINGAIVFLQKAFHLSPLETEFAASALLFGCLLGAAGSGAIGDRFGRRKVLLLSGFLFTLSAGAAALSLDLWTFSMARFAGGLAVGLASTLAPIYISEVAPPERRGYLVSMNQLAIVVGILCAYLSNWGLSAGGTNSWRWMFAAGGVPALGFVLGMLFVPESPRWLWMRGRQIEAAHVLRKVIGTREAERESKMLREQPSPSFGVRDLFSPRFRRRLTVAVVLAVLQQVSGINTVLYYGSLIITEHLKGQTSRTAIAANVVIGVVNLAGTIIAMFFIDRWGRRELLLLASGGMTICVTVLSVCLRSSAPSLALVFTSVLLYVAFFAVGLGPGIWVYIAEIFPTQNRAGANSIAISGLWTACIAVTFTFLSLVQAAGISSAFTVYAILSLATFAFIWKFVPETKGIELEDMEAVWNART